MEKNEKIVIKILIFFYFLWKYLPFTNCNCRFDNNTSNKNNQTYNAQVIWFKYKNYQEFCLNLFLLFNT